MISLSFARGSFCKLAILSNPFGISGSLANWIRTGTDLGGSTVFAHFLLYNDYIPDR